MSLIPEEELTKRNSINLAPMIDFLFLMLAFFACLAVSRIATRDTRIDLVEVKPEPSSTITSIATDLPELSVIKITIDSNNTYYWETDLRDYEISSAEVIYDELLRQHSRGLIAEDKKMTKILLQIDKYAQWEHILKAVFAIRDAGFEARPVYEPEMPGASISETRQ